MTTWPTGRGRDGGIDEIPLPGVPGRLWLCGKHAIGPDPEAVLERIDATTVVCLVERFEIDDRYPQYVEWLDGVGPARAVWFPIHDLGAPQADAFAVLIAELRDRIRGGERLLVHCAAGIGRSGTLAAAVLIALGHDHDEALRVVAANRPMAGPEGELQAELVRWFAGEP